MLKKEDLQVADEIFCQIVERGESDVIYNLENKYGNKAMIARICESLIACGAAKKVGTHIVSLEATDHTPVVKADGGVDWIYKQEQRIKHDNDLKAQQLELDVKQKKFAYKFRFFEYLYNFLIGRLNK